MHSLKANLIPVHCLRFISDDQVRALTDRTRILNLLLGDKIGLLVNHQLENTLKPEDFSKEFVEHLSDNGIKVLNRPRFCLQAKYLTEKHLKILM
ncbi:MAG: hypothetical protein HWD61_06310 [Parachlamydiaceae bacterium]|nr:MAG: hypothetical protein HWD61_06310 [Parachlamydiaceae bacterium]